MTEATDTRTGGCLCGAVRFTARLAGTTFGACHCEMCRRWAGSVFLGITVPAEDVVWKGEDHIATRQTSDWAKRAWCSDCGSALYYRVTVDAPDARNLELPIGLLDNADGLTMTSEIYIDQKPDSFAFAGEGRSLMTRAECSARFSGLATKMREQP